MNRETLHQATDALITAAIDNDTATVDDLIGLLGKTPDESIRATLRVIVGLLTAFGDVSGDPAWAIWQDMMIRQAASQG